MGVFLSRGVSVQGVSVQRGLCRGGVYPEWRSFPLCEQNDCHTLLKTLPSLAVCNKLVDFLFKHFDLVSPPNLRLKLLVLKQNHEN